MNKNYKKPILIANNNLSEGVYLASGNGCYTIDATIIHQAPVESRKNYVIQISATHSADHTRYAQTLTISFNQPVTFSSCGVVTSVSGNGTNTLQLSLNYTQNSSDQIGFGDLTVQSDDGLTITSAKITD